VSHLALDQHCYSSFVLKSQSDIERVAYDATRGEASRRRSRAADGAPPPSASSSARRPRPNERCVARGRSPLSLSREHRPVAMMCRIRI
jgi:hypothetical protein